MVAGLIALAGSSALLIGLISQSSTHEIDPVSRSQMAISLAAADQRKPGSGTIDRLEAVLSRDDRVGDIGAWSRRYAYGLDDSHVLSTDKITFSLKQASSAIRPGRQLLPFGLFPDLDDAQFKRVDGYYVPSSGRIVISYCGWNRGS